MTNSTPIEPIKQELREIMARLVQACEAAGGQQWTAQLLESELRVVRSRRAPQ